MRRIGIIHTGLCNIDSIRRAVEVTGGRVAVVRDEKELADADLLILPGVGSFGAAMARLCESGMTEAIRERVGGGTPLLGICLGMQLLASRSEEGGAVEGLDLVPGEVVRLERTAADERVPHMGWNTVDFVRADPLLEGVDSGTDFYFVHSYHFRCADAEHVLAQTPYCGGFASVIRQGAVWGTQFHPEKSWPAGHRLLANFVATA